MVQFLSGRSSQSAGCEKGETLSVSFEFNICMSFKSIETQRKGDQRDLFIPETGNGFQWTGKHVGKPNPT
jgi:hypothetical protein